MEDILSVIESKAVEKLKKSAFAKEHPNCLSVAGRGSRRCVMYSSQARTSYRTGCAFCQR